MKKGLICFSVICMLFMISGCSGDKITDIEYFDYEIMDTTGTVRITGYSGPDQDVIIPQTIEKRKVTVIGEEAFYKNEVIRSVVVPNGVVTIEKSAFSKSSLKEVELPDSLITIEYAAFYDVGVEEVDIPESVENIDSLNFENEQTVLNVANNSYGLEYAINKNFTYILNGKKHERVDEMTDLLRNVTEKVKREEYSDVYKLIKTNSSLFEKSTYYYQNEKNVGELSTGEATILMKNGVYVGKVKDNKKHGKGIQIGFYLGDGDSYTIADGTWENDQLNGQATYFESNIAVSSSMSESNVDFTYKGNFTNNYYDGKIEATWESDSGTYHGTFNADMGKLEILKEENGRYIYLDNGEGYYWYFTDSTALEGWKVWDGRNSK